MRISMTTVNGCLPNRVNRNMENGNGKSSQNHAQSKLQEVSAYIPPKDRNIRGAVSAALAFSSV